MKLQPDTDLPHSIFVLMGVTFLLIGVGAVFLWLMSPFLAQVSWLIDTNNYCGAAAYGVILLAIVLALRGRRK